MQVSLYELDSFTLCDSCEYAVCVFRDPIEIEEGHSMEIVCSGTIIFEGDVAYVWTNSIGTQIIHAVVSSVASSDSEHPLAQRILKDIQGINEFDRCWLLAILRHRYPKS